MAEPSIQEVRSWHSGLIMLWVSFLLVSLLTFAPGYVGALSMRDSYINATCFRVNGTVRFDKCLMSGWNCGDCYQDCWRAFSAISAVPGVPVYKYIGTFFNEKSAISNANKDVGAIIEPCYYTDGGNSLRFSLLDPLGFLITAIVFLGAFVLTFAIWMVNICRDHKGIASERKLVLQGMRNFLSKLKCCRKRGYSAIESKTTLEYNIDVL